ncbi:MAG: VWA domain-containing protein, partial [Candidatus Solibacter sp.]|nr:VWA domain-containing protein [Candidatus Solibacter sp.]
PAEAPPTAVGDACEASNGAPPEIVFRAYARLVEVHATVTDGRGRYVDDLTAEQFTIRQGGQPVKVAAFEKSTAAISCALLLDTSHSMQAALPALKSAALQLIAALREKDSVAVYSLSGGISELQTFTTDKAASTGAVLRAGLGGETALYDALVRVNRELAGRRGKKAIVVFTDGADNMSTLAAETAILRARTAGVPIHTIAQGIALQNSRLLNELSGMSQATGGLAFTIQTAEEIHDVFKRVLEDLLHGYLLLFQPPPAEDHTWCRIEVRLRDAGTRKVRAREGYFPE